MDALLGLDTSCYTTSAAAVDMQGKVIAFSRMLLPVESGQRGLRQSKAVFAHVRQIPEVVSKLMGQMPPEYSIAGVCASDAPRDEEGSYMPVFRVGSGYGQSLAATLRVPFFTTSHQQGHIAAALYSIDRLDLIDQPFIAFHVSGGTTEAILVNEGEGLLSTRLIAKTLDLNAGQLIDRVGVMLGLRFPCGRELEQLAVQCDEKISIKPTLKGLDCCLSGGENQCRKLLESGKSPQYVARYAIEYILSAVSGMTERIAAEYRGMKVVFAGGVMSDSIIRDRMTERFDCLFAKPSFSSDNAAGVAVLASLV
jgi:N6-L-threonylcarbamoyladenine synthase